MINRRGEDSSDVFRASEAHREKYHSQGKPKIIRKVLVITRHGDTPVDAEGMSLDSVTPKSIQTLHNQGRQDLSSLIGDYHPSPDKTFIVGTNKKRTLHTGLALASGVLETHRGEPESEDALRRYDFVNWVDMSEDQSRIGYKGSKDSSGHSMNEAIYKTKNGQVEVVDFWLQNRDATEHTGKDKAGKDITAKITSGRETYDKIKSTVVDGVEKLLNTEKNLGIIVSHSTLVEVAAAAIIESAGKRVNSVEDIGGPIGKGEYGVLVIDYEEGNPANHHAIFRLRDKQYEVNLANLLNRGYNLHDAQEGRGRLNSPDQREKDHSLESREGMRRYDEKAGRGLDNRERRMQKEKLTNNKYHHN